MGCNQYLQSPPQIFYPMPPQGLLCIARFPALPNFLPHCSLPSSTLKVSTVACFLICIRIRNSSVETFQRLVCKMLCILIPVFSLQELLVNHITYESAETQSSFFLYNFPSHLSQVPTLKVLEESFLIFFMREGGLVELLVWT